MNVFDIIIYLALAWAVFNGWRRGFLLQLISLVAVAAAIYCAIRFGAEAGAMMSLEGASASIVGFLVIFVAAMILISVGGRLLRAVLRLSGLGAMDVVLGVLFSVLKMALVVCVSFSWFATINKNYSLVSEQVVGDSRWFETAVGLTDKITPFFNNLTNNILNNI